MHVAVVVLVLVVVLLLLSLLTPSGFLHNRIPRQADTAYIGIFSINILGAGVCSLTRSDCHRFLTRIP